MAFGFIKKIFSFGKKDAEVAPEEVPALPAPEPVVEAPIVEAVAELEPLHSYEPPKTEHLEVNLPPVEHAPTAEPVHKKAKAEAPKPVIKKPKPVAPVIKDEPETPEPIADEPEAALAPALVDGVYQPTPDTREHDASSVHTPDPLDISSEPEPGHPQPLPVLDASAAAEDKVELELASEPTGSDGGFAGDTGESEAEPESLVAATIPVTVSNTKVYIGKIEDVVPEPEPEVKLSWFQRLSRGLSRSSKELSSSITGIFTKRKLDEDTLQELEDVLIRADLGMETALRITDTLSSGRYGKDVSDEEVRTIMRTEIEKVLGPVAKPLELDLSHKPHVILVVGVNGTGKTTTIGKLSAKLRAANLNVWLAAGDTFRAAAIEQLHIWGQRTGSPVVSTKIGADAAGLAYDAFEKAKAAGADVLIIDTAGRLQNRVELMDELAKIVRVLGKLDPDAPHTVLQTLDATTGQNALNQVEIFKNVAGVNGLVMTKLDGTARGGILVGIAAKHKLPVYFIGVGEQVADLEPFSAQEFASAIAGSH